jgi:hypothetical protein
MARWFQSIKDGVLRAMESAERRSERLVDQFPELEGKPMAELDGKPIADEPSVHASDGIRLSDHSQSHRTRTDSREFDFNLGEVETYAFGGRGGGPFYGEFVHEDDQADIDTSQTLLLAFRDPELERKYQKAALRFWRPRLSYSVAILASCLAFSFVAQLSQRWLDIPWTVFGSEWIAFFPFDGVALLTCLVLALWLRSSHMEDAQRLDALQPVLLLANTCLAVSLALGPTSANWFAPSAAAAAAADRSCHHSRAMESTAEYTTVIVMFALFVVAHYVDLVAGFVACVVGLLSARIRFSTLYARRYGEAFALTLFVEVFVVTLAMTASYLANAFARDAFSLNMLLRAARSNRIQQLRDEKERLDYERAMLEARLRRNSQRIDGQAAQRLYLQLRHSELTEGFDAPVSREGTKERAVDGKEGREAERGSPRAPSARDSPGRAGPKPWWEAAPGHGTPRRELRESSTFTRRSHRSHGSDTVSGISEERSKASKASKATSTAQQAACAYDAYNQASPTMSERLSEWGRAREQEIDLERQVRLQLELEQRWKEERLVQRDRFVQRSFNAAKSNRSDRSPNAQRESSRERAEEKAEGAHFAGADSSFSFGAGSTSVRSKSTSKLSNKPDGSGIFELEP